MKVPKYLLAYTVATTQSLAIVSTASCIPEARPIHVSAASEVLIPIWKFFGCNNLV